MNYKEIIEVLQAKLDEVSDFAFDEYDQIDLGLGEIEEVQQHGGEGKGDDWYSVKYFKDHGVYIRVDGFHTSYDGTSFDNWEHSCREVLPQTKEITVYDSL